MRSSSSETRCVDFFRECVFGALRALWFCGIWVPCTLSLSFVCFYRARLRRSLCDFGEKNFVVNLPELPSFWGTTFGSRGRETNRTLSGGSKKRTSLGGKVSLCATGFFLCEQLLPPCRHRASGEKWTSWSCEIFLSSSFVPLFLGRPSTSLNSADVGKPEVLGLM